MFLNLNMNIFLQSVVDFIISNLVLINSLLNTAFFKYEKLTLSLISLHFILSCLLIPYNLSFNQIPCVITLLGDSSFNLAISYLPFL